MTGMNTKQFTSPKDPMPVFAKTKISAFVLSGIIVLSFAVTSALLTILLPYLLTGDIHSVVANPENLTQPEDFLALTGLLALLLLALISMGAYILYRFFGEKYYGKRGALRWALFGALSALFFQIPDWLFPERTNILKGVWQLLSIFIGFFLARSILPIIPTAQKNSMRTSSQE
jgi:hypothetical protein